MCLKVNTKLTKKNLEKNKNEKFITFYKCIELEESSSHRLETFYNNGVVNVGENSVNISYYLEILLKQNIEQEIMIEHGVLHLYVDKKEAKKELDSYRFTCGSYFIPVLVAPEDILAYGKDNDVCVKKYFVSEKEYDKAVNAVKKYHKEI